MAEVIRITTTADKAKAYAEVLQYFLDAGLLDPYLDGHEDSDLDSDTVCEALAEVTEALGQPERRKRYASTLLDHGHPKAQAPERAEGGMHDNYRETHPAYAMIGASRVTGGAILAGSDFQHQAYMTITIKRADVSRGLSHDYWHGGNGQIIEVALSEAQWATFLSATNMGDGVPCTIQWTETDGYVPRIIPTTNRREQVNDEVKQALAEAVAALEDILADPKSTKSTREKAQRAKMRLTDSVPFVVKSADEHMEKTVEKAKIEVHAYMTGAIQRAGLQALGATPPLAGYIAGGETEGE